MRVAFIIPFTFERFFHDCSEIHKDPEAFEDKFLARRKTWHMSWCMAMIKTGMDVTFFHLSKYGKTVRHYEHNCGVPMIRIPVTGIDGASREEYSEILFSELALFKPDLVFSVTHTMKAMYDMYDRLVSFCNKNSIPVVGRNPHADTWLLMFRGSIADIRYFKQLISEKNFRKLIKSFYFALRGTTRFLREYRKYRKKRRSLKNSDLVIVQTKKDLEVLCKKFDLDEKQVVNLPKPVDQIIFIDIPKAEAARILNLPSANPYLLHVSNLVNSKGCDQVIKLLPEIRQVFPGIKLLVTGNGEERSKLEKLAFDTGVAGNVEFLGHIDHPMLVYYYNIADAMVLPTDLDIEGQPNAILEAVACKTAVITSNLPGPATAVNKGLGILVEPNDAKALKDAILRVISGDFSIDDNAYESFLAEYSFENLGRILYSVFDNIIISVNR